MSRVGTCVLLRKWHSESRVRVEVDIDSLARQTGIRHSARVVGFHGCRAGKGPSAHLLYDDAGIRTVGATSPLIEPLLYASLELAARCTLHTVVWP